MPAGCFRHVLFPVSELESFSVRFNKGFVYNFINSSFASPTSSKESDLMFEYLAKEFKEVAKQLNIKIQWGGNWVSFSDKPHFELV